MGCRVRCAVFLLSGFIAGCGGSNAPAFNSTTTVSSSASYALAGSSPAITLTATVKGVAISGKTSPGSPTGSVNFLAGTTALGSVPLSAATVTLSIDPAKFPIGQDAVTAAYSGDANFAPSTSAAVNVQVQTATTLSLTASPDSVQQGLNGYLLATITRAYGSGAAGGTVTFSQGGTVLGSAAVDNTGTAAYPLTTAQLALASYPVTATYAGDAGDLASNGASSFTVTPAVDVLTQRNNVARTGVQPAETVLTPANVSVNTFGKVFSFKTDGYSYAQPLYVSNYKMSDGKLHNVLIVPVATGSLYAFDADNNNPASGYLWEISVIPAGEQVVNTTDVNCADTPFNTSLIGTPVIDRTRGVIYLVGRSKTVSNAGNTFIQRIHAINLADGTEKLNGPTVITAAVPGTGDGSVNGTVTFDPLSQNQRAGLAEANGSVWISWASHCDNPNYHGWTMGYNANDISQQTAYYNNTPNGSDGGIWMTAGGIAADNLGYIYTAAGNGTFDVNTSGSDYGDTVQRLKIGPNSLTPADWFAPSNQATLAEDDLDFGTMGPLLFDDPSSGATPHLLLTADKTGRVYLIDRDNMGSYDSGKNGPNSQNGDLMDFTSTGTNIFNNAAYFNQRVYLSINNAPLATFDFVPGTASTAGYLDNNPSSTTTQTFANGYSSGGIQPVISANGSSNAIVWGTDNSPEGPCILYAFDANNLSTTLYSSAMNPTRDTAPLRVKFSHPIVANGRVYVAGQSVVSAYGLLQ